MTALSAEAPRVGNSLLATPGPFTRAARHAGLRGVLDLEPSLGSTTAPLAAVAAGILSDLTTDKKEK